jgi:hypothetical protein
LASIKHLSRQQARKQRRTRLQRSDRTRAKRSQLQACQTAFPQGHPTAALPDCFNHLAQKLRIDHETFPANMVILGHLCNATGRNPIWRNLKNGSDGQRLALRTAPPGREAGRCGQAAADRSEVRK